MKVVLTGGAGFIGSNLAHHWCDRHPDDTLVVLDALTYAGHKESLSDLVGRRGFSFCLGDLTDAHVVDEVLSGADLVLHLAAETHNDRAIADPLTFIRTNVLGTATLLEGCRRHDVTRFHQVSTDEVFGTLRLGTPERFGEDSPYRPRGPYSASKAGADHLVRAWSETYGLEYTLSNCGNNFGPYQHPEKFVPLAITRALRDERIPLYGDGKNVRDWIYVADHCEAIDLIAHRGRAGATYLISAENELANIEVLRRVLAILGKDWALVENVPDRPGHDRRYGLDPRRLRQELGWTARFTFDRGLLATIDWYRTHEAWWSPLMVSAPQRTGPCTGVGAN